MHKQTSDFIKNKFKVLEANILFRNAVEKAREKIGIPIEGLRQGEEHPRLSRRQKQQLISKVDKLLEEFNLPIYFRDFLKSYIGLQDFEFGEQRSIKVSSKKGRGGQGRITVEFFADTTLKDIQDIWSKVETEQQKFVGYSPRRKTHKKFDRDRKIYELSNEGLTYDEIAKKINAEFKEHLIYYDIGGILSKFKKNIIGLSPKSSVSIKNILAAGSENEIEIKIAKAKKSLAKANKKHNS